jgi:SnoaL-like polyketide cyclase
VSRSGNLEILGRYSARMAAGDVEHDDLVVSNWTLTGTHTGEPYYDVPPSGERVTINGAAILRFRDGKIVEHWGGPHCMRGVGLSPAAAA